MSERLFYVYAIVVEGSVLYIGKGKNRRAWHHLTPQCRNLKLKAAIATARAKGIEPKVRMLKTGMTEKEAFQLERRWIVRFHERLANATLGQMTEAERAWYQAHADWQNHRLLTDAEIIRRGPTKGMSVERHLEMSAFIFNELVRLLRKVRAEINGPVPPIELRGNELIIIQ